MPDLLITCPPMLGRKELFLPQLIDDGFRVHCPDVRQTLSEAELITLLPRFDGWIIGDDPATEQVLAAGSSGRLRAAVKWGIGIDNVNVGACRSLGIRFANTPHMFASEVADVALCYLIALCRQIVHVDREVRQGLWPKPCGISLENKTAGIVGFGDIGTATARRLQACGVHIIAYDPAKTTSDVGTGVTLKQWPEGIHDCDFLVFTCSLNSSSYHMLNRSTLSLCKDGVRIVNVARGGLIDEDALIHALNSGRIESAALDVYESEPLPADSSLRNSSKCILGSHNASNTEEGVLRASYRAIELIKQFLVE